MATVMKRLPSADSHDLPRVPRPRCCRRVTTANISCPASEIFSFAASIVESRSSWKNIGGRELRSGIVSVRAVLEIEEVLETLRKHLYLVSRVIAGIQRLPDGREG